MEQIRCWVGENFPGADIEQKTYHGQLRFSVPATVGADDGSSIVEKDEIMEGSEIQGSSKSSVSQLFSRLEQNKALLGVQYYSVSQTTLDQVFLSIVGQHRIKEENTA